MRPGHVAREYVEGKRKKYFGPFAFLVITVGLASLVVALTGVEWFQGPCASRLSEREFPMSNYQLAQLNVATLKAPLDSPELKDFVDNLDRINALAESSPGFVWRLMGDGNDATSLRPLGDNVIVNMSVWRDVAALQDYVYKSAHTSIMKRRREWFTRMAEAYMVLWWVPAGHVPTLEEAVAKTHASARARSDARGVHLR